MTILNRLKKCYLRIHIGCTLVLQLRRKRRHRSPVSDVEKVMIWNEYEAYVVQVKQIGTSACGPTAVLNVLVNIAINFNGFIDILTYFKISVKCRASVAKWLAYSLPFWCVLWQDTSV